MKINGREWHQFPVIDGIDSPKIQMKEIGFKQWFELISKLGERWLSVFDVTSELIKFANLPERDCRYGYDDINISAERISFRYTTKKVDVVPAPNGRVLHERVHVTIHKDGNVETSITLSP
jgi:hypothetical protein